MTAICFVNRHLKQINLSDQVENLTFLIFASLFRIDINSAELNFGIFLIFYLFLQNESQRRLSSSSRLNDQERKTRIAFLQNRQAELETEIQLLKQSQEFDKLMTDEPLISDSLLTRYVISLQNFDIQGYRCFVSERVISLFCFTLLLLSCFSSFCVLMLCVCWGAWVSLQGRLREFV